MKGITPTLAVVLCLFLSYCSNNPEPALPNPDPNPQSCF